MTGMTEPPVKPDAKFKLGDRVLVNRAGADRGLVGRIIRVDETRIVFHYEVEFNGGVDKQRYSEFALIAAPKPD